MPADVFDDLAEIYEAMVDWPSRLTREEPFFRRHFAAAGVQSVVDVACGVGRHAAMFHSWNLRVEGADLSPRMIQLRRERFGEPVGLRWVVRSFAEPIPADTPFDAAVCMGNSLPLASQRADIELALGRMFAAVRPGGLVLVHVLNLWRLPAGPATWEKCRLRRAAARRGADPERDSSRGRQGIS